MDQPRDHARGPDSGHPGAGRASAPPDLLAGHLLAGVPWDDRMDAALEALGRLARADRVGLVSSARGSVGSIVRSWSRDSAGLTWRRRLRSTDEALVSRLQMLEEGKPVRIEASDASLSGDDPLGQEGTPRVLALPIFTNSGWWGYAWIERLSGSGWGDAEAQVLLEASRLLGWAVERWTAEIHLRKELEWYRTLVEEAPGLTYAHTDGEPKRILFMSPRIEEVLGYPAEAWLREPGFPWKLLHPDDRNRLEALDALGAPPVVEYRMFARDGRVVRFCDATAPGCDSERRVIHRGVLVDVTSLRDADEAMSDTGMERGSASSTIAAALLGADPDPQLPPHVAGLAEAASQYMREHLAERIDLPSLSSVLAVSPGHLGRLFKQRTGRTPHQYLIDLRLEAAEGLLADTNLTVTQIAWRVGFREPKPLRHDVSCTKRKHAPRVQAAGPLTRVVAMCQTALPAASLTGPEAPWEFAPRGFRLSSAQRSSDRVPSGAVRGAFTVPGWPPAACRRAPHGASGLLRSRSAVRRRCGSPLPCRRARTGLH